MLRRRTNDEIDAQTEERAKRRFRRALLSDEAREHFDVYVRNVVEGSVNSEVCRTVEFEGLLHIRCLRISKDLVGWRFEDMMRQHIHVLRTRMEKKTLGETYAFADDSSFSYDHACGLQKSNRHIASAFLAGKAIPRIFPPETLEFFDAERKGYTPSDKTLPELIWQRRREAAINLGGPGHQEALDHLLNLNLQLSRRSALELGQ